MTIYVATVSDDRPAGEGRLVMLRKTTISGEWKLIWATAVKTTKELVRAWELVGEKIADETAAEAREKEEK